jgi:hypothetical protein
MCPMEALASVDAHPGLLLHDYLHLSSLDQLAPERPADGSLYSESHR